jgi:hypothetical protein
MFSWEKDVENLGDLNRLNLVLDRLPDGNLIRALADERGKGRNDFPVRAMWSTVIAMIVFGHGRFADVIRELKRNAQLRYVCGFEGMKTPEAHNMSRFVSKLQRHQDEIMRIFIGLSDKLYELLPDFGVYLAMDSKWVWSAANGKSKRNVPDGRSETDAEWGVKSYKGIREDGSDWEKVMRCFGFKMHVIVCAKYELPVAFLCSGANGSDVDYGKKFLETIAEERPHILERCKYFMADKAYDDTDLILWLKKKEIKAVIDKRTMWKTEKEKPVPGHEGTFYYNEKGDVFCYGKESGECHNMKPAGYDKERDALRKKCPVSLYGASCREADTCPYCKNLRIPLETDSRIFTQVDRTGYKWKKLYNMRTAVERVNSRLDVSFGFELRRIRGMGKMNLFTGLAFVIMDTLALASVENGEPKLIRSLIRAA